MCTELLLSLGAPSLLPWLACASVGDAGMRTTADLMAVKLSAAVQNQTSTNGLTVYL